MAAQQPQHGNEQLRRDGPAGPGPWAGLVAVRDSKNVSGPALLFAPEAWEGFVAGLD